MATKPKYPKRHTVLTRTQRLLERQRKDEIGIGSGGPAGYPDGAAAGSVIEMVPAGDFPFHVDGDVEPGTLTLPFKGLYLLQMGGSVGADDDIDISVSSSGGEPYDIQDNGALGSFNATYSDLEVFAIGPFIAWVSTAPLVLTVSASSTGNDILDMQFSALFAGSAHVA